MRTDGTYIVPIILQKIDTGVSSLDTSAIDKDIYLTAHDVESLLKDSFYCVKVSQVAINDLNFDTECLNGCKGC